MRTLYITDQNKRDSPVAFESTAGSSSVNFVLSCGDLVRAVKVIKNTLNSHLPALKEKALTTGKKLVDLLIEGDPEIDFDYMGKISSKTKTIYLHEEGKISYNLRFKERIFEPTGAEKECRPYDRPCSNMGKDQPLVWTGKFVPIAKAVQLFAFVKVYQVRHTNGLTFDFLYEVASLLEKKRSLMLMGAGTRGRDPLRLTRGSLPYRAFLMGYTQGESYRLSMHLTNLELKDIE